MPAPEMSRGGRWDGRPGNLVRAVYQLLPTPLNIPELQTVLEPLMPKVLSPLTQYWRGNQGYMYEISPILGRTLLNLAGLAFPDILPYHNQYGDAFTEGVALTAGAGAAEMRESRLGQGLFRNEVLELWNQECSVTKASYPPLLYASHIKPWSDSNNCERIDPYNGLLLTPGLHAPFFRGLITFEASGYIAISDRIPSSNLRALGIHPDMRLREQPEKTAKYLEHHREFVFNT